MRAERHEVKDRVLVRVGVGEKNLFAVCGQFEAGVQTVGGAGEAGVFIGPDDQVTVRREGGARRKLPLARVVRFIAQVMAGEIDFLGSDEP